MNTMPDDGAELLARHLPPAGKPEGPCPDDATLLAFAEGTLPEALAQGVRAHAARCETCRHALGWALTATEDVSAAARVPGTRARALPWAIAAAVFVAAGAVAVWRPWSNSAAPSDVVVEADWLARQFPERWRSLHVPTVDELDRFDRPVERGTVVLASPRGVILGGRARFRWEGAAVGPARLTVRNAAGQTAYTVTLPDASAGRHEIPPNRAALPDGASYVAVLEVDTPLGTDQGRATFRVASQREREDANMAAVEADQRWGALLYAIWTLDKEMWDEAETAADEVLAREPAQPLARAIRDHVAKRRGLAPAPR